MGYGAQTPAAKETYISIYNVYGWLPALCLPAFVIVPVPTAFLVEFDIAWRFPVVFCVYAAVLLN
jgi:hypothetical protein